MSTIKYININNNDVYFLACVNDKILINDNYKGMLILDSELNMIDAIEIMDDLVIYSYYVYQNKILLYCPENNNIVFLDVESGKYIIISLSGFESEIFGDVYELDDDKIILATYKGNFICIDLLNQNPKLSYYNGNGTQVQKDYDIFKNYTVHKVFPDVTRALVGNEELCLIDYRKHMVLLERIKQEQYHDYELMNHCLVKIGENNINMTNCKNEVVFKPMKGYIYLRAKSLKVNEVSYIITLASCNDNAESCMIEKHFL